MTAKEERLAVVTGGAAGIGKAVVARLIDDGMRVIAVDKNEQVIDTARQLGAQSLVLDITAAHAADTLMERFSLSAGSIDVLVNNAGVGGSRRLSASTDADINQLIDTNLTAVMRLTRGLLPAIVRPGGRIINVASIFGLVGYAGTMAYSVAKAGIAQFTRTLASELTPEGVLVNAVAPGVVVTDMTRDHLNNPDYRAVQLAGIPLGRPSMPEEQASVIAFLASKDASFISGVVIPVDGGFTATRHRS